MTAITLWLLIALNDSISPVVERFPTQKDCEAVRTAFMKSRQVGVTAAWDRSRRA